MLRVVVDCRHLTVGTTTLTTVAACTTVTEGYYYVGDKESPLPTYIWNCINLSYYKAYMSSMLLNITKNVTFTIENFQIFNGQIMIDLLIMF